MDLDIGVIEDLGPEIVRQTLFHDHYIAVINQNHPLCSSRELSAQFFDAARHVTVSRRGLLSGLVDLALAKQGLSCHVAVVTYSFTEAILITRATDLIATVPALLTQPMQQGVCCYPLPLDTPSITISQA